MCDPEGRHAQDKKRLCPTPCYPPPRPIQFFNPSPSPQNPPGEPWVCTWEDGISEETERTPSPISSQDQNGDFSPGRRSRQTWGTGTGARKAPEILGAPSPPDAHTQTHTVTQSHTHTHFWKPLGFLPIQAFPSSSPHSWQAPLSPSGPPPPSQHPKCQPVISK